MSPEVPSRPPVGPIYPQLNDQSYRISEIHRIKDNFMNDCEYHKKKAKKYSEFSSTLNNTSRVSAMVSLGTAVSGVGTAFGGLTLPISGILAVISASSGILAAACKEIKEKYRLKRDRHERIQILSQKYHGILSAVVSKALVDNIISHDEIAHCIRQAEIYRREKQSILNLSRSEERKKISEDAKLNSKIEEITLKLKSGSSVQ